MPRRQYPAPSDEKRRKHRPHVKVHLSVATHRRTAELWASPLLRGMLVELWRVAAEAFGGRTGGRVVLSPSAVRSITGCERHSYGLARLRELCRQMDYPLSVSGANEERTDVSPLPHRDGTVRSLLRHRTSTVTVLIRNFPKKQGFGTPPADGTPRSDSDSDLQSLRGIPAAAQSSPARAPARAREPEASEETSTSGGGAGAHAACAGDPPEPEPAKRRRPKRAEPPAPPPRSADDVLLEQAQRGLDQRRVAASGGGTPARSAVGFAPRDPADDLAARFAVPAPSSTAVRSASAGGPGASSAPPAPARGFRFGRELTDADLRGRAAAEEVHRAAAKAGHVARGQAGLLEVLALRCAALTRPNVQNRAALWLHLIGLPQAERGVTEQNEGDARHVLRSWREREQRRGMEELERGLDVMRGSPSGSE